MDVHPPGLLWEIGWRRNPQSLRPRSDEQKQPIGTSQLAVSAGSEPLAHELHVFAQHIELVGIRRRYFQVDDDLVDLLESLALLLPVGRVRNDLLPERLVLLALRVVLVLVQLANVRLLLLHTTTRSSTTTGPDPFEGDFVILRHESFGSALSDMLHCDSDFG